MSVGRTDVLTGDDGTEPEPGRVGAGPAGRRETSEADKRAQTYDPTHDRDTDDEPDRDLTAQGGARSDLAACGPSL